MAICPPGQGCDDADGCAEGEYYRPPSSSDKWRFVGDNRGAYEKVQSYNFVGTGAGSFEREVVTVYHGYKPRKCCVVLVLVATLLLAAFALLPNWPSSPAAAAATVPAPAELLDEPSAGDPVLPPYQCVLGPAYSALAERGARATLGAVIGASIVEAAWLEADTDGDGRVRRDELTAHQAAGQLSQAALQALLAGDFGQDQALSHDGFVAALLRSTGGPPPPDDNLDAFAEAAWLVLDADGDSRVSRRELAVAEQYKSLPQEATQILSSADLNRDGSLDRPEFLAAIQHAASLPVSGSQLAAAVAAAEASWSADKRTWCCRNAGVACVTTTLERTTTRPAGQATTYDCQAGFYDWRRLWSASQSEWCCRFYDRGCEASVTGSAPFDCAADDLVSWPADQKAWCCVRFGRGCAGRLRGAAAARAAALGELPAAPSPSREGEWYDCTAEVENWQRAWAPDKKVWCCAHEAVACST